MSTREFSVIIWGATGFTGVLVAEYFAKNYPLSKVRWALGGRDLEKLAKVRSQIATISEDLKDLPLIKADSSDEKSLQSMVARTSVVLTTVGPYLKYGEPLVRACVEGGTHYCDLTGETPFIMRIISKYHETAKAKGVKIVPCSGFDSIPSDMGALFLANHILQKYNSKTRFIRTGVTAKGGGASGGTMASGVNMAQIPKSELLASTRPYSLNTAASQAELRGKERKEEANQVFVRKEPDLGITAPWIMAAINTRVVRRSASLFHEAVSNKKIPEKENPYGATFGYSESMKVPNYFVGILVSIAIVLFVLILQISPLRNLVVKYVLPKPGEGPDEASRKKATFRLDLVGYAEEKDVKARAVVSGGDPGYTDTSKMIAETAIELSLHPPEPGTGGILTTAVAVGLPLIPRLQKAGINFEIIS